MQRLKSIILVGLLMCLMQLFVPLAYAAAPECYKTVQDGGGNTFYQLIDCSSAGASNPEVLKDDFCYELTAPQGRPADFIFVEKDCQFVHDNRAPQDLITDPSANKIYVWLQRAIDFFTAIAGLAIVAGIIIGGIQYSTSGANPSAAATAKKHITQALIALLALFFMYTFFQWLIPGGLFR